MNVLRLKESIRQRDGYACRDCGITQAEWRRNHKSKLHVHRLKSGSAYTKRGTITLCGRCHVRRHLDVIGRPIGPSRMQRFWTAEKLRSLRARMNVGQRAFAVMLSVKLDTLQNWEQGRAAWPAIAEFRFDELEASLETVAAEQSNGVNKHRRNGKVPA